MEQNSSRDIQCHCRHRRRVPSVTSTALHHSYCSIRPGCPWPLDPQSPGLAEKQCHDIAHRPPHILSQLHRPLLVFTFLSRSFVGIPMFHIYLVGALCLPVHVASRRQSRLDLGNPATSYFTYMCASREPWTSTILLAKLPMKMIQALLFQTKRAQSLPPERHLLGALRLFRHHRL